MVVGFATFGDDVLDFDEKKSRTRRHRRYERTSPQNGRFVVGAAEQQSRQAAGVGSNCCTCGTLGSGSSLGSGDRIIS